MSPDITLEGLKDQVAELREELSDLNRRFLDEQLEAWGARLDELDIQLHLARMDARDDLRPLVERLQERLGSARADAGQLTGSASDAMKAARDAVQNAVTDLRSGMQEVLEKLRG